jgi:hypothetical protein
VRPIATKSDACVQAEAIAACRLLTTCLELVHGMKGGIVGASSSFKTKESVYVWVLDHGMMGKQLEEVCGGWVSLWQIPLGHWDRRE